MDKMLPVPKPKQVKHKRGHQSNPAPTLDDWCIECGEPGAETHECFGGSRRNMSRLYGLTVRLCAEHHRGTTGVHGKNGHLLREWCEKYGQKKFEKEHGSREHFIRLFGRSYL